MKQVRVTKLKLSPDKAKITIVFASAAQIDGNIPLLGEAMQIKCNKKTFNISLHHFKFSISKTDLSSHVQLQIIKYRIITS